MNVKKISLLIASILCLCFIGPFLFFEPNFVMLTVSNLGPTAMNDVDVQVSGESYFIAKVASEKQEKIKLYPRGETGMKLIYTDDAGVKVELSVNCYMEGDYSGEITVSVKENKITNVYQNLQRTMPYTQVFALLFALVFGKGK